MRQRRREGILASCRSCGCTSAAKCGPIDYFVEPNLCAFCKAGLDLGVKRQLSPAQRRAEARRVGGVFAW